MCGKLRCYWLRFFLYQQGNHYQWDVEVAYLKKKCIQGVESVVTTLLISKCACRPVYELLERSVDQSIIESVDQSVDRYPFH